MDEETRPLIQIFHKCTLFARLPPVWMGKKPDVRKHSLFWEGRKSIPLAARLAFLGFSYL